MIHARIARFDVMATVALFEKTFWNKTRRRELQKTIELQITATKNLDCFDRKKFGPFSCTTCIANGTKLACIVGECMVEQFK